MYGKSFARMFQGSMVGSGSHVFAVWGYCISLADPEDHTVDLNPRLLAAIIGDSEERITAAIEYLCAPDPKSHCPDNDGARLVHQSGYAYFLTTHARYRDMKNNEELRAYFRDAQQAYRERQRLSKTVKDSLNTSASASVSASSPEGDSKGETIDAILADFEAVWNLYPSKTGSKLKARKAYERAVAEGVTKDTVLAGLARYKTYVEAERRRGFRDLRWQNGQTWFNGRGWESEYVTEQPAKPRGIVL